MNDTPEANLSRETAVCSCESAGESSAKTTTCCCDNAGDPSAKTTVRSPEEVRKLLNRLRRMEGQIRGICGMVEKNAYCTDILVQSAAVTAAMNAFCRELLASHIRGCVARDLREGKDETVEELVQTLEKLMR